MRKILVIFFIFMITGSLTASSPQLIKYDKQKDLINGESENVSITSKGMLQLAPEVRRVFESTRPFIWDMVIDSKQNIFIATGDGASVFRIRKSGKVDTIAVWKDGEVYSLALDRNENLFAAISPGGKIYRFNDKYQPVLYAELNVNYVWDLLFDSKNNCFVATGDSARIFKIDKKGNPTLFFNCEETHIRAMAWDIQNNLVAGTYKNGYIYRINSSGQGFVIYDSDFEEINKIEVSRSNVIYASALNQEKEGSNIIIPDKKGKESTKPSGMDLVLPMMSSAREKHSTAVIKIMPNGVVKNIWKESKNKVHTILLKSDGGVYVGTGEQGRLYKILPGEERILLRRFPESQILDFYSINETDIYFATANLGSVYKLENKYTKSGSYISPVIDAKSRAVWGKIDWQVTENSQGQVKFFTRSGNTKKQTGTWSHWVAAEKQRNIFKIKSPEARFLQWKVEFRTKNQRQTPVIKNIKVSYLQRNLPPEIVSITIHPVSRQIRTTQMPIGSPEVTSMRVGGDMGLGDLEPRPSTRESMRSSRTNGFRKFSWKTKDGNNDKLVYDIFIRHKGDKKWGELKKAITRTSFTYNSRLLPDGIYQIKLIVSDKKSNPINTVLSSEKASDFFIVDNTGPMVKDIKVRKLKNDSLRISFSASDRLTYIKKSEYSFNGKDWILVYPADLVSDSKSENYDFQIDQTKEQWRTIVIRTTDNANNVGYGRLAFEGKK